MSIKTRKIKLVPTGESKEIKDKKVAYIKDVASTLIKVGNEVIRLHVGNQYEIDKIKNGRNITKSESVKIFESGIGTSIRNSGYQQMSSYPNIHSSIRTSFNSTIYKTINSNFYDILNGKQSIPSYTKGNLPIPIPPKAADICAIRKEDDNYTLRIPSLKQNEIENCDFKLYFGKDKSNNRVIVDRILDGTYKLCESHVSFKDNELYFFMVFDIPTQEIKDLNPEKIMGIDIGINRPVSIYITGEKHQPKQISIGSKVQHDRIKMYKKRSSLQRSLKYSGGGHGVKDKLKELRNLKEKEKNWATNINHQVSKEIINVCLQYKVGTIKMEDLTGITQKETDYFLKSWKYYQLQEFIKYKANSVGIQILWVNPFNTSITCPICGVAEKENRSDKDRTIFKCTNEKCKAYNETKDADVVAAENISNTEGNEIKPRSKKGRMTKSKISE